MSQQYLEWIIKLNDAETFVKCEIERLEQCISDSTTTKKRKTFIALENVEFLKKDLEFLKWLQPRIHNKTLKYNSKYNDSS
jgi:hypothetical protein